MQLPITEISPIVAKYGNQFHHLFQNKNQVRHFENYVTGLITLENKSMANMARCIVDSADKTNISRFLTDAKWNEAELNEHRLKFMEI